MSGANTQIAVAVIGVVGVVSAATIANYDKLFGGPAPAQPAPVAQPTPTPTPTVVEAPSPVATPPVEQVQAYSNAQKDVLEGSTAALENIAAEIGAANAAAAPSAPDISGAWRDAQFSYSVVQQGDAFEYGQYENGVQISAGAGRISSEGAMVYRFDSGGGRTGECIAEVAPGGGSIAGVCGDGANSWAFQIVR